MFPQLPTSAFGRKQASARGAPNIRYWRIADLQRLPSEPGTGVENLNLTPEPGAQTTLAVLFHQSGQLGGANRPGKCWVET